jgi:hypothetical protein
VSLWVIGVVSCVAVGVLIVAIAMTAGTDSPFMLPDQSTTEISAARPAIVSALEAQFADNGPVACAVQFLAEPTIHVGDVGSAYVFGDCRAFEGHYEWAGPVAMRLHRKLESAYEVVSLRYVDAISYESQESRLRSMFPTPIAAAIIADGDALMPPSSAVQDRISQVQATSSPPTPQP